MDKWHVITLYMKELGIYRCACNSTGDLTWAAGHIVRHQFDLTVRKKDAR